MSRVIGVDACRPGWIGVVLEASGTTALWAPTIDALVDLAAASGPLDVVAIDMPIGLADTGKRQADHLARHFIGPRASSVFTTPVRGAVLLDDYRASSQFNAEHGTGGISQQAFALRTRIREVDGYVRSTAQRVVEVHPEVCFAAMAGTPLISGKKTWAGMELRRGLLRDQGILLSNLGEPGERAGVDDVLDAAAAAWSAMRVANGHAKCLPEVPEVFSDGWPCAIWY